MSAFKHFSGEHLASTIFAFPGEVMKRRVLLVRETGDVVYPFLVVRDNAVVYCERDLARARALYQDEVGKLLFSEAMEC